MLSRHHSAIMADPDLRIAILKEMASIRRELADLADTLKPPLGPSEFVHGYTGQLKARLAKLEDELKEG